MCPAVWVTICLASMMRVVMKMNPLLPTPGKDPLLRGGSSSWKGRQQQGESLKAPSLKIRQLNLGRKRY